MKLCEKCGACFDDGFDLCGFDGAPLSAMFSGTRVIGERYLLEQRVASGAMGVVLRATHLQVGSTVAVKLMRPQKSDMHVALARFHREAQILGQIKHPNAVLVIDFGIEKRGHESVPFLVMEYLRGQTLLALLDERKQLAIDEVDRIVGPLCDAVEEAHEVGVIHRDLKPGNVVLEKLRDGSQIVKVLDFGIAKFVSRTPERAAPSGALSAATGDPLAALDGMTHDELRDLLASDEGDDEFLEEVLVARAPTVPARRASMPGAASDADGADLRGRDPTTEAGFMIGTIPYMAPEQMTGQRVSRATDVHAIAVLVFELLAGRLPHEGDDEDIIASKLSDERPSLREIGVDVPAALDEVLMRAFALAPEERPSSVREISAAVRAAAASVTGPARAAEHGDGTMEAVVQLGAASRAMKTASAAVEAWSTATMAEDAYARARDQLLVLDGLLRRVRVLVQALDAGARAPALGGAPVPRLSAEQRTNVGLAKDDLEDQSAALRRSLARSGGAAGAAAAASEYGEYLAALWMRQDLFVQEVLESLTQLVDPAPVESSPLFLAQLFQPEASPRDRSPEEIVEKLLNKDPLDATDAIEELLEHQVDTVVRTLQGGAETPARRALCERLLEGLWRHADALLLHEMQPGKRGFRLLPFLARLPDLYGARAFAALAHVFNEPALDEKGARAAFELLLTDEDRHALARCLLVHPSEPARRAGVDALPLSDLWTVIAHEATPVASLRFVFEAVRDRAPNEFLKIFFFCAKDNLAAHAHDVGEALLLVEGFFQVPCFHEDIVFEPLLDLERALRQRAHAASGALPNEARYAEKLAAFTAGGVSETRPLEHMKDVPLPIQRKLAREGHFLGYFVSHSNDRVARETLPHLFRLEDVTAYLRIPTIHRIVLTELSRKKRFFRKEPAKLALLTNPKLPAVIARVFLPLVSHDQLRILSTNKHINPDVRRLILASLNKLPS